MRNLVSSQAERRRHGRRLGFTLIELMLVLAVIAISSALVWPTVSTLYGGASLKAVSRNVMNLVKFTRSTAVTRNWICRMEWNPASRQWAVTAETKAGTNPGEFTRVPVPANIREMVPKGIVIFPLRVLRAGIQMEEAYSIEFRPDGTCDEAFVYLGDAQGRMYTVALVPMTGQAIVADFAASTIYEAAGDAFKAE